MAETIKIGGELESTATGNKVTDASAVKDKAKGNKSQAEFNSDVVRHENEINGSNGLDSRLRTVEELAEISVGGGDIGIGTAADFESDNPSDLAKVPTVGAMLGGANDGVYDISARHNGTKYADLETALGTNGANVPQSLRKGGMSVKFVQSSDNKYVQCRLMAQNFTTDTTQWQGVDNKPILGSGNIIESGGIAEGMAQLGFSITQKDSLQQNYINGLIQTSNHSPHDAQVWNRYSYFIPIKKGETLIANVACDSNHYAISVYSTCSFDSFVEGVAGTGGGTIKEYTYTASNDGYIVVCCTEYFIQDYTFAKTNYYIYQKAEEYFIEPIVIQESIAVSKTIELNAEAGDYFYIKAKPHGQFWLSFKNGSTEVAYLEFTNGMNFDEKFVIPNDIDKIVLTVNGQQVVDVTICYKGVVKDILDLEEYEADEMYLYGHGSLYKKYKWGQIYKETKRPNNNTDDTIARHSDFILIAKNDIVTMHCAMASNHYAIAFYTDRTFESFVGGVLGDNINTKKDYTYVAPEDGYIILSSCEYATREDFSDSNFTIEKAELQDKENKRVYYAHQPDLNFPFGEFQFVKNLVNSENLENSDYRKTYPGLGYDVAWDEENNRYVMLTAGYNESIGYAQIGLMYSSDLKNWNNYGVVLSPTGVDGDPDKGSVTFPQLLKFREKWLMFYVGFDQTGFEQGVHKICYAESTDFINWTRKGVVLTREDFVTAGVWTNTALNPGKGVIYRPRVINVNGMYYMFINGGPDGDANTGGPNENVYVAISDNPTKGWKVLDIVLDPAVLFPLQEYKICSDPDVIFDGQDFVITWWGNGGIFIAKSNIFNFPFTWKVKETRIVSATRPLFVATQSKLYLIVNEWGSKVVSLYQASWFN